MNLCVPTLTNSVASKTFFPWLQEPEAIIVPPFFQVYEQSTVSPSESVELTLYSIIALSDDVIVRGDDVTRSTLSVVATTLPSLPPVIITLLFTDFDSPAMPSLVISYFSPIFNVLAF